MLTPDDLKQIKKAIRTVVREEVEAESENRTLKLTSEIKMFRIEIQSDLRGLSSRIKDIEIRLTKLEKEIKKLTKIVLSLDNFFAPRIKRLEEHTKLPPLTQD